VFPLIDFMDFHNKKIKLVSEKLNFMMVDAKNSDFLQMTNIPENFILIIKSDNSHFMAEMRSFFIHNIKINNPFVLSQSYEMLYSDKLIIYSSTDIGSLFVQGFGDGIFISSNSNDIDEIKKINSLSFKILQAARVRVTSTDFISCPSCGRTLFDLQETTAMIRKRTDHLKGLKIGIMGCIVNGPGEMADADYGYVGSGKDKITLYKGQEVVKRGINYKSGVEELVSLIKEDGNWIEP